MRTISLLPAALVLLLTSACSQAQSNKTADSPSIEATALKKGDDRRKDEAAAAEIVGLTKVGSIKGIVPESSGLAPADAGQSYFRQCRFQVTK